MALVEWSDALVLGVGRMDDTHREFVDQLNALYESPDEEFLAMYDEFLGHTVQHFGQENDWMAKIDFPPAHCHTGEHENVLNLMRDIRERIVGGDIPIGRVLVRELGPWFTNHAGGMDTMLAYFIKATGFTPPETAVAEDSTA